MMCCELEGNITPVVEAADDINLGMRLSTLYIAAECLAESIASFCNFSMFSGLFLGM